MTNAARLEFITEGESVPEGCAMNTVGHDVEVHLMLKVRTCCVCLWEVIGVMPIAQAMYTLIRSYTDALLSAWCGGNLRNDRSMIETLI